MSQTHSFGTSTKTDNKELASILCLTCPQQMPTHYKISLLSCNINSWLILLLQHLPVNKRLWEEHMTTNLAPWPDRKSTASQLDAKTSSWTNSASKNKSSCWEQLPWLSGVGNSLICNSTHWLKAQSEVHNTSNVVQTFWSSGRQNPAKDADNELSIILLQQFRAFRNEDTKEKQQKALPFSVLNELAKYHVTETDKSITQFTISTA
jgi:hypothetical protein